MLTEPTYDASTLPLVIAPSLRSDEVVNTEAEKKSVYLSSQVDGEKNNHFTINRQFALKYWASVPVRKKNSFQIPAAQKESLVQKIL